jgi:hypothetical protein
MNGRPSPLNRFCSRITAATLLLSENLLVEAMGVPPTTVALQVRLASTEHAPPYATFEVPTRTKEVANFGGVMVVSLDSHFPPSNRGRLFIYCFGRLLEAYL